MLFYIALLNLLRQKKITILLGSAIIICVFIITILQSFFDYAKNNITENISKYFAGHIFIEGIEILDKKPIVIIRSDLSILNDISKINNIKKITKRTNAKITFVHEGIELLSSINGIDLNYENDYLKNIKLVNGSLEIFSKNKQAVIINREIANKLNIKVGENVIFRIKTITGQNNIGNFFISGIMDNINPIYESIVYSHRDYLNSVLCIENNEYQVIGIVLSEITKIDEINKIIKSKIEINNNVFEIPEKLINNNIMQSKFQIARKQIYNEIWEGTKYHIFTINDLYPQIINVYNLLNIVSIIIFLIIYIIIMIGFLITFNIIIIERRKEIGILRSIGLTKINVVYLIILESVFIILLSYFIGIFIAFITIFLLKFFNYENNYLSWLFINNNIIMSLNIKQIIQNLILIMILTILSIIIPAKKAANIEPAIALKNTV